MSYISDKLGFGLRAKLILLFVVIKVVPLILIALVAWYQAVELGNEMRSRTENIADRAVEELSDAGALAVADAVKALDDRATDEIERMTTDAAQNLATFLYARDDDLRFLSTLEPSEKIFKNFLASKTGLLVKPREWVLAEDGKSWVPATEYVKSPTITLRNEQNKTSFQSRPPDNFIYESVPLYLEATYIDLKGQEILKVTSSDLMDPSLKNVADRKNTFCKAEGYFSELQKLKTGEIYVSDVIGEYVGSSIIGMYTPENAQKKGISFEPEKAAYVGDENPNGKRFKGLVRFAMPVEKNGEKVGYITIALNHDHIMSKVEHIAPDKKRYADISSAAHGNYAFIWDHEGRSIFHPRHHSIAGYNAETGQLQPTFLDDVTYKKWQESGLSYTDFIKNEPQFSNQSRERRPALDAIKNGMIGLDCRYLNFAPQCTGWYNLAQDGGSGSFLILWSGLWKLTTVSAIPYYTGQYGKKLVGFGILTMTMDINDFHSPALETQKNIQRLIEETDEELSNISRQTFASIANNLWNTATSLSVSTLLMTLLVVLVAIWMASALTKNITQLIQGISQFSAGYRRYRFNIPRNDEFGVLCNSLDELFNSIVNSTKSPMTITDLDQKILYMNRLALEILDKTFAAVKGKYYPELTIFGEGSGPIPLFLANEPSSISYHVGTKRYYKSRVSYLVDKKGDNIGYIIEAEDVTQLIAEQDRIERERVILDMVLSASPDMIWYKSVEGIYLAVNPRFASMIGLSPEEIQGRHDKELLSESLYAISQECMGPLLNEGAPTYTESRVSFADGHEEILDIVRTPIFGPDGNVRGILGVGRDVSLRVNVESELRQTQRDLMKAVTEANEASKSKSEFLARMSHEIRTPMNAIIGMTNITKRILTEEKCSKEVLLPKVLQIESSSIHLLGLLNDILDISKIEAGKIELSEESFDLPKLVNDVASIIAPRCDSKNIAFTINVEGFDCKHFITDVLRLRQILINLLGNAVKFTPELGSITFHVALKERKEGRVCIFFSVADSGIGIAPERLKNLFAPFEQGGGHITRMYGGTGLGLSISRSIARLLGSEIEVISEENKGSEFFFSLWIEEDTSIANVEDHNDNTSITPGKRVLLVDDVDINRIIAMELLAPFDLIIDEAGDGTEAVQIFEKSAHNYYDLVLMDIQMPKMNGYEATKALRALDRSDVKTIPIVAMTANAFKEDIDMAFASGMNGHVAKPIEMDKLVDVLKKYLGK